MAAAADIPPEILIRIILVDICEEANWLLNLDAEVPNRKEAIKAVTACSLACVYWARVCRKQLFQSISIKNYEDMRAFSTLVSTTPKGFTPVSGYVYGVTLVQRVEDRPWIHLLRLQPSLCASLLRAGVSIRIVDSIFHNDSQTSRRATSRLLFASLPRAPPPSCFECENLTIENPCFQAPQDLTSLLRKFTYLDGWEQVCWYLTLSTVTWETQTVQFQDGGLTRDILDVVCNVEIKILGSRYVAETAWLVYAAAQRSKPWSPASDSQSQCEMRLLPTAQRAILHITKLVCQIYRDPNIKIYHSMSEEYIEYNGYHLHNIWNVNITEPEGYSGLLQLFALETAFDDSRGGGGGGPITVNCISAICIFIGPSSRQWTRISADVSFPGTEPQEASVSVWEEIGNACAAQDNFIRLQFQFQSYDDLVQFIEAQQAALAKLHGRIGLFYFESGDGNIHAANCETLVDLGDAYEQDYLSPT